MCGGVQTQRVQDKQKGITELNNSPQPIFEKKAWGEDCYECTIKYMVHGTLQVQLKSDI